MSQKQGNVKRKPQFHIDCDDDQKSKSVDMNSHQRNQQSEQYVTPAFLKTLQNPHPPSTPHHPTLFYTFNPQSNTPLQQSSQPPLPNQKKSKAIIKSKKERSFVGLMKSDKVPPYLESIMKRKEVFRSFMVRHAGKTYGQLVEEERQRQRERGGEKAGEEQEEEGGECAVMRRGQSFIVEASSSHQNHHHPSPTYPISTYPTPIFSPSPSPSALPSPSQSPLHFQHSFPFSDPPISPSRIPQTPSFVPISDPLTPLPSEGGLKINDLLMDKLKEYEMEDDDDLSIQLI